MSIEKYVQGHHHNDQRDPKRPNRFTWPRQVCIIQKVATVSLSIFGKNGNEESNKSQQDKNIKKK